MLEFKVFKAHELDGKFQFKIYGGVASNNPNNATRKSKWVRGNQSGTDQVNNENNLTTYDDAAETTKDKR